MQFCWFSLIIDLKCERQFKNLKLQKKKSNFSLCEIYRNAARRSFPKLTEIIPKFRETLQTETDLNFAIFENSWKVPAKIFNFLIFIDNRLEDLRLLNFWDFYLKFSKIWKISIYKNSDFFQNNPKFREIYRYFAKRYFPKLTEILPKFREIYRNWQKYRETDFEFRC